MIQEAVDDIFAWQRAAAAAFQQSKPILPLKNKREKQLKDSERRETKRLVYPGLPKQFTDFQRMENRRKTRLVRQGTMVYHGITHLSLFAWLLDTSMIPNEEGVFCQA